MLYFILYDQNLTPQQAVLVFLISMFIFMLSLTLHEFAHGFVAYKMGDKTPKLAGRLTINPFRHLDAFGFICFVLFGVGWAKPMPINPLNFKKYRSGIRWTSIAGVSVNFVFGLIASICYAILFATVGPMNTAMEYVFLILEYIMVVNSFLFMFNILPIYPMDGFNFISSFLKPNNNFIQKNVRNGFKIMLFILIFSLLVELLTGFDILSWYLNIIYSYIYLPIVMLGV